MELETDRLLLREFVAADWPAVFAYQSNPLYLRYYPWPDHREEDAQAFVDKFIRYQEERPRTKFQLAITRKGSGRLLGNCGIRINDLQGREANIGYELDPQNWGQGYATEAAGKILNFGFKALKMGRIWATTLSVNQGSIRVLEKLGMRREGYEPKKVFIKGRWYDSLLYAILDHEYDP